MTDSSLLGTALAGVIAIHVVKEVIHRNRKYKKLKHKLNINKEIKSWN